MRRYWNRFLDTLSFITTIRVRSAGFDPEFHRIVLFFPTAGLLLGCIYEAAHRLALPLFGDFAAAVIAVAASVILTGGLHLDGLGDTFDGIYSYRSKERILEIMKDSRVGTNALLAVFLVLLLKIGALQRLSQLGYTAVFFMPVAGRTASMLSCRIGKNAKKGGSGTVFIGKVETSDFWLGLFSAILYFIFFSAVFGGRDFILVNLIAFAASQIFTLLYIRDVTGRIGGLTGDVLGALCELSEMVYLLALCIGGSLWILYW